MLSRHFYFSVFGVYCALSTYSHADWKSPYYIDHPLVGRIYAVERGNWVTAQEVYHALEDAQFLLLGETHTNTDHHMGQANVIAAWLTQQVEVALVLEMLEFERWRNQPRVWSDLDKLRFEVKSAASEWNWELYNPILQLAVEHKLPIIASNLSKQQRSFYARENNCRIERDGEVIEFCDTMNAAQLNAIEDLILDAHCGYLQPEQLNPLAKTQIAKDASFALSLYQVGLKHKVVLLAGAIHVRKDIGVPVHLQRLDISSISIAFISVDPEWTMPNEYISQELGRQYDYIYFTPSERNTDPCVEFVDQLKIMKDTN